MKLRPLLAAPFAAAAGVAVAGAGYFGAFGYPIAVGAALVALVVKPASVRLTLVLTALFSLGVGRYETVSAPVAVAYGQRTTVTATVVTPPARRGNAWSFVAESVGLRQMVRLRTERAPRWGERVRLTGYPQRLPRPTNPGEFDYGAYLERQGVAAVTDAVAVEVLPDAPPLHLRIAAWLRATVDRACAENLPEDVAAVAKGILLSLTDDLDIGLRDDFSVTGTVHILSTSGMHLAVIAGALHLLLRRQRPVVRSVVVLSIVWLIALAAGFGPAVNRSALTLTVCLCAPLLRREPEPLHALALAAVVLVLHEPRMLWDPGAQLSFVTVAALLLGMPTVEFLVDRPGDGVWSEELRPRFATAVSACALASAASAPLTALHFHQVSTVAPLANVPIAALSEVALLAGVVGVATGWLPVVGPFVWATVHGAIRLLVGITERCADSPAAALSSASPPSWLVVAALCGLLFGLRRAHGYLVRSRLFRR